MHDDYERMFYLPAGPIAAIVLGMALVPLREYTNSANFIFAFMVLIIVVAEFGGRWAALATATCSALSLNFFLTRPYLSLRIEGKHDIIAFVGLAVCGLVAAALGSRRGERVAALSATRAQLDLVHSALGQLEEAGPLESRLAEVLRVSRDSLPLAGAVIRDLQGNAMASSGIAPAPRPSPAQVLQPVTLLPRGTSQGALPPGGLPLPPEGGRLELAVGDRPIGWLELWGNGEPADLHDRRALADVARLLTFMMGR